MIFCNCKKWYNIGGRSALVYRKEKGYYSFIKMIESKCDHKMFLIWGISINISKHSHINIEIYDLQGKLVTKLAKGWLNAGKHTLMWNGNNKERNEVSKGIYLLKFKAENDEQIKQMFLLR